MIVSLKLNLHKVNLVAQPNKEQQQQKYQPVELECNPFNTML